MVYLEAGNSWQGQREIRTYRGKIVWGEKNSYIRTRGLILLAYNAKWDKDNKIDEVIDKYLKHITDVKPITARQCIKLLPIIAKYRPELKNEILSALHKADISVYDDSMQPLVYKDIQKVLKEIQKS